MLWKWIVFNIKINETDQVYYKRRHKYKLY